MHLNCTEDEARYSASLAHGPEKKLAEDWLRLKSENERLMDRIANAEETAAHRKALLTKRRGQQEAPS